MHVHPLAPPPPPPRPAPPTAMYNCEHLGMVRRSILPKPHENVILSLGLGGGGQADLKAWQKQPFILVWGCQRDSNGTKFKMCFTNSTIEISNTRKSS